MSVESAAFWLHSLRNFGNPRSDYFFRVIQTTLISKALHKTLHTLLHARGFFDASVWVVIGLVFFFFWPENIKEIAIMHAM